jgi:hypothetical protein
MLIIIRTSRAINSFNKGVEILQVDEYDKIPLLGDFGVLDANRSGTQEQGYVG